MSSGATYLVTENGVSGTVEVAYNNQNHWSSQEPAGSFSAMFGASGSGSVDLDYSNFIPGTTATDDGIIGVSDGDNTVGTDTNLSNGSGTGISGLFPAGYPGLPGPESIGEEIPANFPIGAPIYRFVFNAGVFQILP